MVPWVPAKAKVQLRLGVQRLRTLQEKKSAQAKAARRDIAFLLEKGKLETARIKVENIIHEDIYVELLELLELYCELLISRFGLLDQNTREPDAGVSEGVCAIIHAAPRTELKELQVLRDMLMHKYGREFAIAVMENRDGCVSERVTRKLAVFTPGPSLVDAYLAEIAKGYGVDWSPPEYPNHDTDDAGGDGGVKAAIVDGKEVPESPKPVDSVTISAEARSAGVRTPKLPELPPTEEEDIPREKEKVVKEPPKPVKEEDDFETLAKRFEALKKR
ncbi:regulator of Vps4 activity in the MVB pathway-domain-containing protein [Sparassis latifolia]|uniref:Vacuolar protein sorting-associated protein n=1 Tax=Sparassis crispa TaxID=139825 RepID=A0A401G5R5_9APHY|nr:Vacuolar protein sorting-associated protein [Sparassis crispa]GBE77510.1 Vacuolar protein sorting-associated protein [Sparassis crispa]